MCEGSDEKKYTHFVHVSRDELLKYLKSEREELQKEDVDQDMEDPEVSIKVEVPPAGLYT